MKKLFFLMMVFGAGTIYAQNLSILDTIQNSKDTIHYSPFTIHHSKDTIVNYPLSIVHSKDPVIAWLINFPAGLLGLHRAYLGTSTKTVLLYIFTAGGFLGIIPTIDWILLMKGIQTGDISKYVGNRKFLMWR